jgi:hypothetical protein
MDNFEPPLLSSLLRISREFDGSIITPSVVDLNCMHWNINHLSNKLHRVEQYIASFIGILHIIVISETWLTSLNLSTYRLQNYHEVHNVRQNVGGGGISIFVHNSLCSITPKILIDLVTPHLNHFLVLDSPS